MRRDGPPRGGRPSDAEGHEPLSYACAASRGDRLRAALAAPSGASPRSLASQSLGTIEISATEMQVQDLTGMSSLRAALAPPPGSARRWPRQCGAARDGEDAGLCQAERSLICARSALEDSPLKSQRILSEYFASPAPEDRPRALEAARPARWRHDGASSAGSSLLGEQRSPSECLQRVGLEGGSPPEAPKTSRWRPTRTASEDSDRLLEAQANLNEYLARAAREGGGHAVAGRSSRQRPGRSASRSREQELDAMALAPVPAWPTVAEFGLKAKEVISQLDSHFLFVLDLTSWVEIKGALECNYQDIPISVDPLLGPTSAYYEFSQQERDDIDNRVAKLKEAFQQSIRDLFGGMAGHFKQFQAQHAQEVKRLAGKSRRCWFGGSAYGLDRGAPPGSPLAGSSGARWREAVARWGEAVAARALSERRTGAEDAQVQALGEELQALWRKILALERSEKEADRSRREAEAELEAERQGSWELLQAHEATMEALRQHTAGAERALAEVGEAAQRSVRRSLASEEREERERGLEAQRERDLEARLADERSRAASAERRCAELQAQLEEAAAHVCGLSGARARLWARLDAVRYRTRETDRKAMTVAQELQEALDAIAWLRRAACANEGLRRQLAEAREHGGQLRQRLREEGRPTSEQQAAGAAAGGRSPARKGRRNDDEDLQVPLVNGALHVGWELETQQLRSALGSLSMQGCVSEVQKPLVGLRETARAWREELLRLGCREAALPPVPQCSIWNFWNAAGGTSAVAEALNECIEALMVETSFQLAVADGAAAAGQELQAHDPRPPSLR
ncbi:unnamed protein product [Prorocentrum cordatum]|uniref:Uncharacterized protein n=1 Tax=Prorocentrum cordatum TaxID=2364126 RepID=A0ABN9P654_9DINO|nr:unnamed protein product [Polarella glacialis]